MSSQRQLTTTVITSPVGIRFSPEEKAALIQRANREHRAISQLARMLILQALEASNDFMPKPTVVNFADAAQQQHATSVAAG